MDRNRVSGAHPDDRDPQLLDDTRRAARGRPRMASTSGCRGVRAWAELVGAEVAAALHAGDLRRGRLVARTDSTAWAIQLRLLAPTVVRRLNEELGHGTVTVIEVLGPPARPGRRAPGRPATDAGRATPTADPARAVQRRSGGSAERTGTCPHPCEALLIGAHGA